MKWPFDISYYFQIKFIETPAACLWAKPRNSELSKALKIYVGKTNYFLISLHACLFSDYINYYDAKYTETPIDLHTTITLSLQYP
jgi:hypothetical protein